jgi:hypothetical protein
LRVSATQRLRIAGEWLERLNLSRFADPYSESGYMVSIRQPSEGIAAVLIGKTSIERAVA